MMLFGVLCCWLAEGGASLKVVVCRLLHRYDAV
jgi:hypothetical protein